MLRIEGRRPNASGQMMTAACAPVAGWMNAASHVPSGVLISTVFSVTFWAETFVPAAASSPAGTVIPTNSRRVRSSLLLMYEFSSAVAMILPDPRSPIPSPSQRFHDVFGMIHRDDEAVPAGEIRVSDVDVR